MSTFGTTEYIEENTRKANKTYGFNEAHHPSVPAQMWFQHATEGLTLFVVLYSMACQWSRCLGCNLPSKMSKQHVPYDSIMEQIDSIFSERQVRHQTHEIRKLIVSNNGSILDEHTFSSTALMYLLAKVNFHLPKLQVLTLETRPEYVDIHELEFLSRALKEGETNTDLELAIGFEAFDSAIRNDIFDKGLPLDLFERFVAKIAPHGFSLKCYFMQKPVPAMTDKEAIEDIKKAIDYLSDTAQRFDIQINMHLNPTYVAKGTLLEEAFHRGEFRPPVLADVVKALRHAEGKNISLFVGLSDEGLAIEGGSFLRSGDDSLVELLEQFNQAQDFSLFRES